MTHKADREKLGIRVPSRGQLWRCRTCGYNDNVGERCVSCGRDFIGFPGPMPSEDDKPYRSQLRGGAEEFE
jgi:hypothetical protein